jgi:hypothetical protein
MRVMNQPGSDQCRSSEPGVRWTDNARAVVLAVDQDPVSLSALELLERGPLPHERSIPGMLAAGDVRHGSLKRVATAAGAGSAMVASILRSLADTTRIAVEAPSR